MALTYKENVFFWSSNYQSVFIELKSRLVNAPLLVHFNPNYESIIEIDAFNGVLSGVFL
jgi:hypothetical protein